MRILEARDGFIKFETEKRVALSSFLLIKDISNQYVAQVIKTLNTDLGQLCYAKLLFVYDGTLKNYDRTLPSKDSELEEFTFDILSQSIDYQTPIVAGKFIGEDINIPMDVNCFNKKMLVCVDSKDYNNTIISNLSQQFAQHTNVLVVDMLGTTDSPKFVAGVDFKLPLNTDSLEFMFEDCLNDATSDSKSLIKEIFKDLSDYSKTVPFLPFGALKSIVDDMVDKSHIFKLLVLKNKLAKFDKLGYFAATAKDANNLKQILALKTATIDISKLDTVFQNRYLSVIYSELSKLKPQTQVILETSNAISKKNLKTVLTSDIPTLFVTHSRFKYINEIKTMFDNFIIEPSFTANEVFKTYGTFLNSMTKGSYLVVGEGTNYIPFVSVLEKMNFSAPLPTEKEVETTELSDEELNTAFEEQTEEPLQEEDSVVSDNNEELESHSEAIEKKSDELIEKVSEDIEEAEVPELFSEENTEAQEQEEKNPQVTGFKSTEFHTNVTPTEAEESSEEPVEISEEISEDTVLEEIEPEENSDEIQIEETEEESATISDEEPNDLTETDEQPESEELLDVPDAEPFDIENDSDEEFESSAEIIEMPEDISDLADEAAEEAVTDNEPEIIEEEAVEQNDSAVVEPEVIPLTEQPEEFEDIVELDDSQISDEDILVELEDSTEEESDSLDDEIVKDVDKVFTTMKEDTITDSDLDFIDELNNEDNEITEEISLNDDMEELPELQETEEEEDGFLEPLEEVGNSDLEEEPKEILEKRETSTPIVPVYNADIPQEDLVISDQIEQGDTVLHAKYGSGIVEKMIKYGTKTLYSINFDNVGRRLLDPTLTEIKKA